jgi:aldehyde:ferredoxin oxidoreductase
MIGGYMGKILWVNLEDGEIREEVPDEKLLRDYIGGYGLGARLLYDRIPAKTDPLGPENVLGVTTGPLTGSTAPTGTRWTIVGKSPLTGGWGDANGSGFFGPALKRAGYDALFFEGISERPVYLYLEENVAQLRDAGHLWGMDTYEIEDWVKTNLGKDFDAICIGPSGEKLSLISGVFHAKGRTAARSGLGAVMGSKRLKMVVASGRLKLPGADKAAVKRVRKTIVKEISDGVGSALFYSTTGTPGYTPFGAQCGDSPTKNWSASTDHFEGAEKLSFDELLKYRVKKDACWRCQVACWGTSRVEYSGKFYEAHQPEYETASSFGTMTMNNDYPSLIAANEICNRYGLDSISAGSCVAFAIECFENGLIGLEETGGINLRWGDHEAMNAMLEKIAKREDFGDILADGVKKASEKLGPLSESWAIHIGGQELPAHDPRFEPGLGVIYKIDATPGRHTQAGQYNNPPGYPSEIPLFGVGREKQIGRGTFVKDAACLVHAMQATGFCLFGFFSTHYTRVPEYLSALTGWDFTVDEMLKVGERIANIRQAFNVREGINAVTQPIPLRAYGRPPLPDGPTAGINVQVEQMLQEHLENMGWTQEAAVPEQETLEALGLQDIAKDLWG